ncbi:MAG TPA: saccharopine dehydrogenase NADP-binding domain-containing protein [Intrasporangium sp.]|uniref:saccharopine dehydrogenase family protein n=1 Tax=Intrasporangium sp. TaxID=1925024 RepID=UPI002D7A3BF3|nr:saccharopine dehydrogenase NADP-binding domain-containing protein [Intrasporangium sp.]HET7399479.1 saccharopine dehydrogenase NADP-binding domain-containing protein [Intrasporangium sp.]
MTGRELDIVLFGATGFVGALTAAHLAREAGPDVRVALAGRSRARLESVRAGLGASTDGWELVEVDATDASGLRKLAARTTVLASTVGPYAVHGREVVRACAEAGTAYADLTGEVLFVRWSLDEVDARARETGARIVHACGFDSIPSDLGVLLLARRAAADGEGTLGETTLRVRSLRGGLSGGTIDSGRQQAIAARADPSARAVLADPYGLSPRRAEEPPSGREGPTGVRGRLRTRLPVERDPRTGRWSGPFLMASFNTRIVRLSNTLSGWSYGRGLRYREATDFGSSPVSPLLAAGMAIGLGGVLTGLSIRPTRAVLDRVLPRPGQGPDAATRAAGRFRMEIETTTTSGARYLARVGADYDPGYDGTAVMLGQSALCLARDGAATPARAGVLTPATAMGEPLVARLRAQGFTFEVSRTA